MPNEQRAGQLLLRRRHRLLRRLPVPQATSPGRLRQPTTSSSSSVAATTTLPAPNTTAAIATATATSASAARVSAASPDVLPTGHPSMSQGHPSSGMPTAELRRRDRLRWVLRVRARTIHANKLWVCSLCTEYRASTMGEQLLRAHQLAECVTRWQSRPEDVAERQPVWRPGYVVD